MRILLIGSSFCWGVKDYLNLLINSSGRSATIAQRGISRYTLAYHASDPTTLARIDEGWDWVVLQEQSDGEYAARYPAARTLNTRLRDAGALPIMMMTWRDRGEPLSRYDSLKGVEGGSTGYVPIAFEIDARIAPTGWIYRQAIAENRSINLWNYDGHHANNRGNYLNAMAIFAAIYKQSPVGLKCPTPNIFAPFKLHDQTLVNTVALTGRATWNIPA